MKDILAMHSHAHPSLQPQDAIKLCYQAAFGAEHLLINEEKARNYFDAEWESVSSADIPLWEMISEGYGRINLAAWKHMYLPREWLFRMFVLTASEEAKNGMQALQTWLETVDRMASENQLPFTYEAWIRAKENYLKNGGGTVHHSEIYRQNEHPSYRVIDRRYIALIPLLQKLAKIAPQKGQTAVIAIDGQAASGKTTLAKQLSDILGAGVIHMDDFFLPPDLRTPDRLAQAGGNVHYERFAEQVIPHLRNNEAFTYPTFNCSKMCLDGKQTVIASPWRIAEGSYSHHPQLGHYMDLRIFCHVSSHEQLRRIRERNGKQMAAVFAERWIPMEELYFRTYAVREHADIQITNESTGQGEQV